MADAQGGSPRHAVASLRAVRARWRRWNPGGGRSSWAWRPAAQAQSPEPTTWLCLPGQEPNPCAGDQTTTVYNPDGTSTTKQPKVPADPKVDCFYVYPTVSDQPTQNANKNPDPPISGIAKYQAQRFSQICDVYAPIYRQRTITGIFNPTTNAAEAGRIAYGDVLQAWRDYLATTTGAAAWC